MVPEDWYMLHESSCKSADTKFVMTNIDITMEFFWIVVIESINWMTTWECLWHLLICHLLLAGRVCFAIYVVGSFCKSLCIAALWACLMFDVF